MRIFRIPFSTNVERVALALAHKGSPVEWVDVDPEDRSAVREVSGQDLVPVLQTDKGEVVADSMRIVAWLEARRPDPPLWPAHAGRRAEVDVFIEWFNLVWKGPPMSHPEDREPRVRDRRLEARGELPNVSLTAASPVSLRTDEMGVICDWEKANDPNFKIFYSNGQNDQARFALTAAMMKKEGKDVPPSINVPFKTRFFGDLGYRYGAILSKTDNFETDKTISTQRIVLGAGIRF